MKRTIKFTHNGLVIKRNTDRIYTHVVLGRRCADKSLAVTLETVQMHAKSNHDYYVKSAAQPREKYCNDATWALYQANAAMTLEEYTVKELQRARDRHADEVARGCYKLGVICWNGRRDLAEKEASKHRGWMLDVEIVEIPEAAR